MVDESATGSANLLVLLGRGADEQAELLPLGRRQRDAGLGA
jgi:hypothetical protein